MISFSGTNPQDLPSKLSVELSPIAKKAFFLVGLIELFRSGTTNMLLLDNNPSAR